MSASPKKANSEIVSISVPENMARKIEETSERESLTRSELMRTALRTYFDLREYTTLQRDAASRARELGIESEEDIEELVESVRDKNAE